MRPNKINASISFTLRVHLETMPKSKSRSVAPVVQVAKPAASSKQKRKRRTKSQAVVIPYHRLIVDPFRASLEGAAKPDLNTRPVVVWREEEARTLTTDAQGNLWWSIKPSFTNMYQANTMDVNGAVTAAAAYSVTNYTELSTTFTEYRPTALAVMLEYVGQADLAKGVIFAAQSSSNGAIGDSVTSLVDEPYYAECRPDAGYVAARFVENSTETFSAIDSVNLSDPVGIIHVGALGLPASSACLRLRVGLVVEAVVGHSKLLSRQASPSPANLVHMSVAANLTGPSASVQSGPSAYEKLVAHGERLIGAAMTAHGLLQRGAQVVEHYAPLLALMAA